MGELPKFKGAILLPIGLLNLMCVGATQLDRFQHQESKEFEADRLVVDF